MSANITPTMTTKTNETGTYHSTAWTSGDHTLTLVVKEGDNDFRSVRLTNAADSKVTLYLTEGYNLQTGETEGYDIEVSWKSISAVSPEDAFKFTTKMNEAMEAVRQLHLIANQIVALDNFTLLSIKN